MKRRSEGGLIGFFAQRNERGASLVEYSLLVSLIAVVCIGSVRKVGKEAAGTHALSAICMSDDPGDINDCNQCLAGRNSAACQAVLSTYLP